MARRRHTPEQVINKLREAEVAIAECSTVAEAARRIGVTQQTFYRWRTEYGGLRIDQAKRLKRLESENSRHPLLTLNPICLPARVWYVPVSRCTGESGPRQADPREWTQGFPSRRGLVQYIVSACKNSPTLWRVRS